VQSHSDRRPVQPGVADYRVDRPKFGVDHAIFQRFSTCESAVNQTPADSGLSRNSGNARAGILSQEPGTCLKDRVKIPCRINAHNSKSTPCRTSGVLSDA
jgi:hypothetical protein